MLNKFTRGLIALALVAGTVMAINPAPASATIYATRKGGFVDDLSTQATKTTVATTPPIIVVPDTKPAPTVPVSLFNLKVSAISYIASLQGGTGSFAQSDNYAIVTAYTQPCPGIYTKTSVSDGACTSSKIASQEYQLFISTKTELSSLSKKQIALSDVKIGDRINISGTVPSGDSHSITVSSLQDVEQVSAVEHAVQISHVRIDAISSVASIMAGGPIAEITASTDSTRCERYESVNSSKPLPCSEILSRQYQITVTSKTKLLALNRKSIDFSNIAVGDYINVYGTYLGDNRSQINALVIRDLKKVEVPQTIQVEKLKVFTSETNANGDIYLTAGTRGNGCYEFSGPIKKPYPCVLNVTSNDEAVYANIDPNQRPTSVYKIYVGSSAQILDGNRRSIARKINVGDTINVYGTLKEQGSIIAQVVRITSNTPLPISVLTVSSDGQVTLTNKVFGSVALAVNGGTAPYSWSEETPADIKTESLVRYGMPPGMSLTTQFPSNCTLNQECPNPPVLPDHAWIAGTPSMPGTYLVNIGVRDSAGNVTKKQIQIVVAQFAPSATTNKLSQ